jgi:hypothetical protein
MLNDIYNILLIVLMLTGALCWVSAFFLCWLYWSFEKREKEK